MNDTRKTIGRILNKWHFKTYWKAYIKGEISYSDLETVTRNFTHEIRRRLKWDRMTADQFEGGWYHYSTAQDTYAQAYRNLIKIIYIDW